MRERLHQQPGKTCDCTHSPDTVTAGDSLLKGSLPQEYPHRVPAGRHLIYALMIIFIGADNSLWLEDLPDTPLLLCHAQRVLGILLVLSGLFFFLPASLRAYFRQRSGKSRVILTETTLTMPAQSQSLTDDCVGLDEIDRICVDDWPDRKMLRVRTRIGQFTVTGSEHGSQDLIDEIAESLGHATGRVIERESHRPWQFSLGSIFWVMTTLALLLGFHMWTRVSRPSTNFISFAVIFLVFQGPLWLWLWRWLRRTCAPGRLKGVASRADR